MRKLGFTIVALIVIAVGICAFDVLSGYEISKKVDDFVYSVKSPSSTAEYKVEIQENGLNNLLYSQLSDDEKDVYDALYNGISTFKSSIYVGISLNSKQVFRVYGIMLSEHPEIFWVTGSCTYSTSGFLSIDYTYSKDVAKEKSQQIEAVATELLNSISGSEYDKSLALFDYVVCNTSYDHENLDNLENVPTDSTIEGVFLNNTAVCAGYAKAYQYLLQKAGMQAVYITGTAETPDGQQSHAWVCQQLDSEYYFSDPTWCDSFENIINAEFVSHIYFCNNSEELLKTHTPNDDYSFITSTATRYNYFVKEELYYDSYNVSEIRHAILNEIDENNVGIEFEFSNAEEYQKAIKELFDNGEIYIILKSVDLFSLNIDTNSLSYSTNDNHNSITIIYAKNQ